MRPSSLQHKIVKMKDTLFTLFPRRQEDFTDPNTTVVSKFLHSH